MTAPEPTATWSEWAPAWDAPARPAAGEGCQPSIERRSLDGTIERGQAHLEYRGICLRCDWVGPVHDRERAAVEDAHDHSHPEWRTLEPIEPPVPHTDSESERKRHLAAALQRLSPVMPPRWLERHGPIVTWRDSSLSCRPVAGRSPFGGYDIGREATPEILQARLSRKIAGLRRGQHFECEGIDGTCYSSLDTGRLWWGKPDRFLIRRPGQPDRVIHACHHCYLHEANEHPVACSVCGGVHPFVPERTISSFILGERLCSTCNRPCPGVCSDCSFDGLLKIRAQLVEVPEDACRCWRSDEERDKALAEIARQEETARDHREAMAARAAEAARQPTQLGLFG